MESDKPSGGTPPQPEGETVYLAIVSNHKLFRDCLGAALANTREFKVTALAADDGSMIERLKAGRPDVTLIDVNLMNGSAASLIQDVRAAMPRTKLVILGLSVSPSIPLDWIVAGINGYVSREASLEELKSVIPSVFRGEVFCSPKLAYSLFSTFAELSLEHRAMQVAEDTTLTPRELEILQLINDGLNNRQIAGKLYLSLHTVKNHVHNILEKLKAHHRSEAATYAMERGFLRKKHAASGDL